MTQDEVRRTIIEMRFRGGWPCLQLAKEAGLSAHTVRRAMSGDMSQKTQTRLEMTIKGLKSEYDRPKPKGKPGHKKRYMIRYLNLKHWIKILENEHGSLASFRVDGGQSAKNINSGYTCCKFDYIMKRYVLAVFGDELQKKKITMGDCYPVEQWVLKIQKSLPGFKRDLVARLISRRR